MEEKSPKLDFITPEENNDIQNNPEKINPEFDNFKDINKDKFSNLGNPRKIRRSITLETSKINPETKTNQIELNKIDSLPNKLPSKANITSSLSKKKIKKISSTNKTLNLSSTLKDKQYNQIIKNKSSKNNLKQTSFELRLQKIEKKFLQERSSAKSTSEALEKSKCGELEYNIGWLFYSDKLKKKKREAIQEKMKNNDKITILLAFLGIVFNIIASAKYITFSKSWNDERTRISINIISNYSSLVIFLRYLTTISTLIMFFFIYRHYTLRLESDKFKQKQPLNASMYSAGLLWMFIFEIILCSVHSPPFLNDFKVNIRQISGASNLVDLDIFLSSMIPIRVYLLFRYHSFYSSWADDRAEKICNECNTIGGISFAIKAELKERPYPVVGVLMILSILIFGYALRNLELSFMQNKDPARFQDWTYVYNGFWCIIITILTVGYGDFYPQTSVGRVIAVIACLWGTFLISLMVVSITISVEFTPQEQKAYDELKKGEIYRSLKSKALNLIRFSIKLMNFPEKREQIKDPDMRLKYIKTYDQLKQSLNEFSISRKFVLSKEHESGAENILYKLNENVGNEMEKIIVISNKEVTTLLDYLKLSQTIQEEIDNYMEKLDKMTEGLEKCLDENEKENDSDKITLNEKVNNFDVNINELNKIDMKKEDTNNNIKEVFTDKDPKIAETLLANKANDIYDLDHLTYVEIDKLHQKLIQSKMLKRLKNNQQNLLDSEADILINNQSNKEDSKDLIKIKQENESEESSITKNSLEKSQSNKEELDQVEQKSNSALSNRSLESNSNRSEINSEVTFSERD